MRAIPPVINAIVAVLGLCACTPCAWPTPQSLGPRSISDTRTPQLPIENVAAAIRTHVGSASDKTLGVLTVAERKALLALYGPGGYRPLWTDAKGQPSPSAHDALGLLEDAASEGLDPRRYHPDILGPLRSTLGSAPSVSVRDRAAFDAVLSLGTLRYLRELHNGQVDPRSIGFRMTVPADEHEFAALLGSAIADRRVREAAAALAPPYAQYRGLKLELARYRSHAADASLATVALPGTTAKPGETIVGLAALQRRLVALGDLRADTPGLVELSLYEGEIVEGVKRFQARHGLEVDGILGPKTHEALRVPLAWRVRQIELALERLRWLPHVGNERFIAVNIPMFRLWAWDSIPPRGRPSLEMGVIVGRALNTRTPIFDEKMEYLIFRPYWNVPSSILQHEILPAMERDPDYLQRQDMEIVSGPGDDARPVAATAENIERLRSGALRVRQRPGPKNSLGLVKFVFPNDNNVYMHATPTPQLFRRPRRDFSHGCVRLEDPIALAEWALSEREGWTRDRIVEAMNATGSRRVYLDRPVQVFLVYITALVMAEGETIRFAEDIYGHDRKLDRALAKRASDR